MAIGEAKTPGGRTVQGAFVSLREVAKLVKVHSSTILRWLGKEKVTVSKYKNRKGHWVFRKADVAKFKEFAKSVKEVP